MKSLVVALLLLFPCGAAFSQDVAYSTVSAPSAYVPSQAELDQLLAPVALYPDALLGNILAASTYPLEVVELSRWLERNPDLTGAALEAAAAAQPWDASVKALAPFRNVVSMMNGELDWTQRLGNAFLADEAGVMDSVQRLRGKARDNGALADNPHERVIVERDVIIIEPAQPDTLYVPYYDPLVVYGSWWWPDYPPYAWAPYYFGPWEYFAGGIAFGAGIWITGGWHSSHPHPDWHGHHLVDHHRGGPSHVWNHNPSHRFGVPYADDRTHNRYRPGERGRPQARQDFRGFDVRPGAQPPTGSHRPPQDNQPPRQEAQRPGNPAARYTPPSSGPFPSQPSHPSAQAARPQLAQPQVSQSQIARPQLAQPQSSYAQPRANIAQPQSHALQPMPNPIARQQSARGHESLASRPSNPVARAPAPSAAPSMPSRSSAPSGGHSAPAPASRSGGGHK